MDLNKLPKQYRLIYNLSEQLFIKKNFKCVALVSKTPYLTALIACHGAKIEIVPPFSTGTCILLPEEDLSKGYFHAVIDETVYFDNEKFYYFRRHKKRENSNVVPVRIAKKTSFIESVGKVFPNQKEHEWLGKRNIHLKNLSNLSNSLFPVIVGKKCKSNIDYWLNIPLGIDFSPDLSMANIINTGGEGKYLENFNIQNPYSINMKNFEEQIWINNVPKDINEGNFLIILSPYTSNFDDLTIEVNDLYAENNLTYLGIDEVGEELRKNGIGNKAIFTGTIMKEKNK